MTEATKEDFTASLDSVENRRRLRGQIIQHLPQAQRVLKKSGIKPSTTNREETRQHNIAAINIAGELVREKYKAETDSLTGIPNRDGYIRRGREELERAKRLGYKVALVVLDLNNLKEENDTKGHEAGDELLRNTALCLKDGTRITDGVARWGGDEFGAILANTDYEGAQIWWKRVNDLFKQKGLSIGAGVVIIDPSQYDDHTEWETVFNEYRGLADKPLYKAKDISKQSNGNYMMRYDHWLEQQNSNI